VVIGLKLAGEDEFVNYESSNGGNFTRSGTGAVVGNQAGSTIV
jgi:hypothetical protein